MIIFDFQHLILETFVAERLALECSVPRLQSVACESTRRTSQQQKSAPVRTNPHQADQKSAPIRSTQAENPHHSTSRKPKIRTSRQPGMKFPFPYGMKFPLNTWNKMSAARRFSLRVGGVSKCLFGGKSIFNCHPAKNNEFGYLENFAILETFQKKYSISVTKYYRLSLFSRDLGAQANKKHVMVTILMALHGNRHIAFIVRVAGSVPRCRYPHRQPRRAISAPYRSKSAPLQIRTAPLQICTALLQIRTTSAKSAPNPHQPGRPRTNEILSKVPYFAVWLSTKARTVKAGHSSTLLPWFLLPWQYLVN